MHCLTENMNGSSKGNYSIKASNSGGTPGGASRVHKIDSLTPYQNRLILKGTFFLICSCLLVVFQAFHD